MRKGKLMGKIFGIALVLVMGGSMFGGLPGIVNAAGKFDLGDTVEICNAGTIGIAVRNTYGGDVVLDRKFDGELGMVLKGPQDATRKGIVYTWWMVRWEIDNEDGVEGLEGWIAEGYPGGEDYLKEKYISPSARFTLDDPVTVTASLLYVRTDWPELAYKGEVHNGDEGVVKDGPFYGVPKGSAGLYYFWKVDYGSIVGWSAEDYLEKVTPCPHSCWDRSALSGNELAALVRNHFPLGAVTQTGESIRVTAYAVAIAESCGGNPSTCGDCGEGKGGCGENRCTDYDKSDSIGLWQINIVHGYDKCRLFEEDYNANAAVEISSNGADWNPWCTWEKSACGGNGNEAYKQYLTEARKHFYPKVTSPLSVSQTSINLGEAVKIYYSVSDDVGLARVELWRTTDKNGAPDEPNWAKVPGKEVSISGTTYSDYFTDTPTSPGIYWYGIHVVDNSGAPEAWNDERNSRTGGLPGVFGPIEVKVVSPNQPPELSNGYVDPSSGNTSTDFYYYVSYFDPDGDSPSVKQVIIDGTGYTMSWYSGSNSHITYRYGSRNLSAGGTHYYFFYFEDGRGGAVRLPAGTDMYLGPSVSLETYPPQVTTEGASSITTISATLTGNLDSTGGETCQVWFQYGTTTSYGSSTTPLSKSSTSPFGAIISSLSPDTTYHFRACALNSKGTRYGSDMTFKTEKETYPPQVTTEGASSITATSAMLNGNLNSTGGLNCQVWFEWWWVDETGLHERETPHQSMSSVGSFNAEISDLSAGEIYNSRACASNSEGTSYGLKDSFTTLAPEIWIPPEPIEFGDVIVGDFAEEWLEMWNLGTATLTINSVTRTSGSSDFTPIYGYTPFDIEAGESELFLLFFQPSSEGPENATFTINSNDPYQPDVTFDVLGNGIAHGPRTWHVDDDLQDYPDADFTSIKDAVNASSAGDTIIVYPGTYTENVDVNKDHLTIRSENGAEATIVRAANSDDHVFEVTADYVNVSGLTVKGAIGTIEPGWKAGIYLYYADHCSISNNICSNDDTGIHLHTSSSNIIANNNCFNSRTGISISLSSNNTLKNNNCSNNEYGISIAGSSDNNIENNHCNSNYYYGIHHYSSTDSVISGNTFEGCGMIIYGYSLEYFNTHTIQNNIVNGKPIYYYKNTQGVTVPEDAGQVMIANCSNMVVRNINASSASLGIELAYTTTSVIENNTCSNNKNGIYLWYSSSNKVTSNICNLNTYGINLCYSSDNTIKNNIVSGNTFGAVSLSLSSNNIVYLNDFINTCHVYFHESTNTWNSPEEITYAYNGDTYTNYLGNYWSDYTGSDNDGDGIGDTPYSIDSDNDNYPLMEPFENYEAGPGAIPWQLSWVYDTDVSPSCVSVPSDGAYIAIGGTDKVYLLDHDGNLLWSYETSLPIVDVSMTGDASYIVAGGSKGVVIPGGIVYCLNKQGELVWFIESNGVSSVSLSPDGNYFALTYMHWLGWNDVVTIWGYNEGEWLWDHQFGRGGTAAVSISTGGNYIAVGGAGDIWGEPGELRLYDKDGSLLWKYVIDTGTLLQGYKYSVSISSDGSHAAAGNEWNDNLYFFDLLNGKLLWQYKTGDIEGVSVSPDGEYIAAATAERVYLFNQDKSLLWTSEISLVEDISISAGAQVIVVVTGDNKVYAFSAGPDTTSPTVVSTSPEDGATDVSVDAVVTATFSKPMDSSTINETSFTLEGSAVSGTVTYNSDTYTATFTPDDNLEYNHEYTTTLSTVITDVAGNPLANLHTWSFTTGSPQNHPPVASSLSLTGQPEIMYPNTAYTVAAAYHDPDGADDLKCCYLRLNHPEKPLTMMWNQATDKFWTYAGEEGENYLTVSGWSIPMADTGYDINWIFEINENWPEVENSINFGVLAMDDGDLQSGWDYDNTNASFVKDTTLPTVVSISPEAGDADVDVGTEVTATFSEAMDSSTITITTNSFTLDGVSGTVTYDSNTYTATFIPDADLEYKHEYTATLSTAITDLAGNPLAKTYTWSFTTLPPYGPFPYGYKFANGAATQNIDLLPWIEVVEGLTEDDKRIIFEETFDWSQLTDPVMKELLFSEFKDKIGKGGNCYGMVASSLMEYVYADYDRVLETQDADYLWNLDTPWVWPLGIWDGRNMQEKPILKHILKFQLSQYGISPQEEAKDFNKDPMRMVQKLEEEGKNYIIGVAYCEIVKQQPEWRAHALTPYEVKENGDKVKVYVCDPNWPDKDGDMEKNDEDKAYDRYIEIDKDQNSWRYLFNAEYWPSKSATSSALVLVPIEAHYYYTYDGTPKPGGKLTGYPGPGYCLADGNVSLTLTDSEGRTTGFQDSSFVEEIPGVKPIYDFFTSSGKWGQAYYVSNDTRLMATIEGVDEGTYSVTKFGSDYFADVSNVSTSERTVDNVTLSADSAGLSFSKDQEPKTYDLVLHVNMDGGNQTFTASNIPATPGGNHEYTVNWTALSQGEKAITIEIDSDGDGEFEETIVTSQPNTPSGPSPSNGASGVPTETDLSWTGGDPDAGDTVTYDVYFGASEIPPLVSNDQADTIYAPDTLRHFTKYYWRIVTRDNHGIVKEGPVWNFTTPSACFIATAAYGTPTAEELDILREFRDEVLLPDKVGAAFVSFYYHVSPPIADFISQHKVLKTIVREGFIDPLVAIVKYSQSL